MMLPGLAGPDTFTTQVVSEHTTIDHMTRSTNIVDVFVHIYIYIYTNMCIHIYIYICLDVFYCLLIDTFNFGCCCWRALFPILLLVPPLNM